MHGLFAASPSPFPTPIARRRQERSTAVALQRQNAAMGAVKRERWSEADVLGLPAGEHDYFERKSGALFARELRGELLGKLAKALSAFANSGGGHLVLGIEDDGRVDGVPRFVKGRAST